MSFKFSVKTERCTICSERVYFNEKVYALKRIWHKNCFKCASCNKVLALGSQSDNGGEPYCQKCYQRNFGPRGFRGGSFGSMVAGNYDGDTPVVMPSVQWTMRKSMDLGSYNTSIREKLDSDANKLDNDFKDLDVPGVTEEVSVDEPIVIPKKVEVKKTERKKSSISVKSVKKKKSIPEAVLPPPAKAELEEAAEAKEKQEATRIKALKSVLGVDTEPAAKVLPAVEEKEEAGGGANEPIRPDKMAVKVLPDEEEGGANEPIRPDKVADNTLPPDEGEGDGGANEPIRPDAVDTEAEAEVKALDEAAEQGSPLKTYWDLAAKSETFNYIRQSVRSFFSASDSQK